MQSEDRVEKLLALLLLQQLKTAPVRDKAPNKGRGCEKTNRSAREFLRPHLPGMRSFDQANG